MNDLNALSFLISALKEENLTDTQILRREGLNLYNIWVQWSKTHKHLTAPNENCQHQAYAHSH